MGLTRRLTAGRRTPAPAPAPARAPVPTPVPVPARVPTPASTPASAGACIASGTGTSHRKTVPLRGDDKGYG